jgi:hypothetical protein
LRSYFEIKIIIINETVFKSIFGLLKRRVTGAWHHHSQEGYQTAIFFKHEKNEALYSYPYLNQQKPLFLPIIAYTLSTTKLEIRAK